MAIKRVIINLLLRVSFYWAWAIRKIGKKFRMSEILKLLQCKLNKIIRSIKASKKQTFSMVAAILIVTTIILSLVIPALSVKATSLTWTTNGDFSMNTPGVCGAVTETGVVLSGNRYTDVNCSEQSTDEKISLQPRITGVISVKAGNGHSLALKQDGSVWAWGTNVNGQLGDNTTTQSDMPLKVKDSSGNGYLTNIIAISAAYGHSLALKSDGTVWAWGSNTYGQLGDNTTTQRTLPVQVKDPAGTGYLSAITAINGDSSHSMALKSDGTVWAWGSNTYGQLGDNTTTQRTLPVQVKNSAGTGFITGITMITSGGWTTSSFSAALRNDGTVWTWGRNVENQLGDNTATQRNLPVQVKDPSGTGYLTGISTISSYSYHTVALKNDGTVWSWGNNTYGQIGDNTITRRGLPVQVRDSSGTGYLSGITQAVAGYYHSLAYKNDGTLWAWGRNVENQLGDGTTDQKLKPTQVRDETGAGYISGLTSLSGGGSHTLVLRTDGGVSSWGSNSSGQLGIDVTLNSRSGLPVTVRSPAIDGIGHVPTGTVSGYTVDSGDNRMSKWFGLNWNSEALPSGTSITFNVRTSNDYSSWSNWSSDYIQNTEGSNSGTADLTGIQFARFIEIKLTLSTSGTTVNTPTLNDFTLSLMTDKSPPPINASNIKMYSNYEGRQFLENAWVSDSTPYFSWDAAADGADGSGIAGYCLYLGHDSSADVSQTKGSFLGNSPINSQGSCQYLVGANSIDFSPDTVLVNPLSTTDETYYLLVKGLDKSGNLFDGAPATFAFRYDNTPPNNLAFVSLPGQFIPTKDATITWPTNGNQTASDMNSGLAGIQYRIGNNGIWYGAIHNGSQDNTDVLPNNGSYQTNPTFDYPNLSEGNNLIYFRSIDNAGNVSSSLISAALRINTSSPSSPQSLVSTPNNSINNSFAFSWAAPQTFVGQISGLTYCYSVNTLPTESTCSYTSPGQTSLASGAYATQPGENTFYVAAKDEAGNINYATAASTTFTANTAAPGMPLNAEIADISVKITYNWKLALSWEPPTDTGSGVSAYRIFRSTNQSTGFTQVASTSGTSFVDNNLAATTHYYYIKACDSSNHCGAQTPTISKLPTGRYTSPAELNGAPIVSVGSRKATVSWNTSRTSDSKIQIGTKNGAYRDSEFYSSNQTKDHKLQIDGLDSDTTYYYKAKWTDEDGNTGSSVELSFTTLPAPVVKNVEVIKKTINSATIQLTSKDAIKVNLSYGKTENFGGLKSLNTSTTESSYIIELTGLDDGATYIFRPDSFDVDNNVYNGNTYSFATPQRPRISNLRFQPVTGEPTSTQQVSWTTNVPTNSTITYGKVGTAGSDIQHSTMTTSHEIIIRGLEDDSEYFLLAQGRDDGGNLAVSDRQTFHTALDTRPPKITDVSIESTIRGSGAEARGQVVVAWKTDEPSTSQVAYAEGTDAKDFNNKTMEDSTLTTEHVVIVSDLPTSKVYSIQPISKDKAKNQSTAKTEPAIIGRASDSVLTIILNTMRKVFGL